MEYSEDRTSSQEPHSGNGMNAIAAKAEEKARELREAARSQAGHRVQELSERAQQRLDGERDRVASRIEGAALRLRQRADAAGPLGHTAGEQVANRMEAAAGYLHQHQTTEIAGDFATYVKKHPIQSVIAAGFVGYLIGRVTG